jgi:hypothetical protein
MPPRGDIFSTPEQTLDTSTEAMEERGWEPDMTQAEPEGSALDVDPDDDVEDDEELVDGDGIPLTEDSEEDEADESDDAEAEADEPKVPEALQGKTPEELAKIIADQRSFTAEQSDQVGQLRALVEQQAQQINQLLQGAQQPQEAIDVSGWEDEVKVNPQAVYGQALDLLDRGHIDIGQMDDLIDYVSEVNPRAGRQIARDFDRRLNMAQMNQQFEPVQTNVQRNLVESTTAELWNSPDEEVKADTREYHTEIAKVLNGVDLGNTQAQVKARLEQALVVVRGRDPQRSYKYKKALEELKANSQVEQGTSTEREEKKTEADKARDLIFNRRKRDPAAALFADLA